MSRTCEQFEQEGTVARYVAGRAGHAESVRFEDHYLECAQCFDAVVLGAGVRSTLRPAPAAPPAPRRLRGRVLAAGGVGMAAVLATLLVVRGVGVVRVQALGGLDAPPPYQGVAVRADESRADQDFETAMQAYADARYKEAAAGLEAALRAGVDAVPAEFFLGASLLQLNQPAAAVPRFEQVVARGDSPYAAEARYYLAKALLRLGRGEQALGQLRAVAAAEPIAPRAAALADSIAGMTGPSSTSY